MVALYIISMSVVCLSSALFGVIILLKGRNKQINLFSSLFLLTILLWALGRVFVAVAPDKEIAILGARVSYSGSIWMPLLFLLFVYSVVSLRLPKILLNSVAFISLLIWTTLFTNLFIVNMIPKLVFNFYDVPGPIYNIFSFLYSSILIYAHLVLLLKAIKLTGTEKTRLIYLLVASLFAFVPSATTFPLVYNIPVYPFGVPLMTICPLIFAYAIVRHRLMDIELIIKRGFIYSVLIAFVLAIYSFSLLALQTIFHGFGLGPWFAGVITAMAIALGFKPIESLLTDVTDRYFFKKKYEYRKTLLELSKGLNQLMPLDSFARLLMRRIVRTVRLKGGAGLVFNETEGVFKAIATERNMKNLEGQKFVSGDPLIAEITKSDYLLIDDIEEALRDTRIQLAGKNRLEELKGKMNRLNVHLAVPIRGENKVIGVALLGEKLSEDAFSDEDLDLLVTLSAQAGMALVNVKVYDKALKQFHAEHDKTESLQKELDRSQRLASLGTIAAGVAHEIRNPLTVIYSKTEKIANEERNLDFLKEFRDAVLRNADRITKIISGMLDLAKVREKERFPLDLNNVIEDALQFYTISRIKLVKDFKPLPNIKGDREELKQVFINLLSNAINAMPEGGELKLSTSEIEEDGKKFICAEVADTGVGIPKGNLDKIFDPFFSTRHEGTGLGLSIVYRIVREHGGSIDVKSKLGKGSTFTLKFPPAGN